MALLMTPGPTDLPPEVIEAVQRDIMNPDVQPAFQGFYRSVTEQLQGVYETDHDVVVLSGEGILGLEASIASLVEPGTRVLCLANGRYGRGFANLVELYDGRPIVHEIPGDASFDPDDIRALVAEADPVVATMVHCETPTGILNDLEPILDVLAEAGVLSVVDAVSSLGGTPVPTDQIDLCLGASQKCLSAPPGLATIAISDRAWARIIETPQRTRYTSLLPWQEWFETGWFPYTMPVMNLYALDAALERILDDGMTAVYDRHEQAAQQCRDRGRDLGLSIYAPDRVASPTVTAFDLGDGAIDLQQRLAEDHDVIVSTGLGENEDRFLRIGHMGYNASTDRVDRTMDALADVFETDHKTRNS